MPVAMRPVGRKSRFAGERLYVRRGYIPDGNGLVYHDRVVTYGEQVSVDDGLVLCFTKAL